MKPRYRPGKPATGSRAEREAVTRAKPLSKNEMEHLKRNQPAGSESRKAGRKGRRASWNTDYEEGVKYDILPMPFREPESLSIDGLRRRAKRGGR